MSQQKSNYVLFNRLAGMIFACDFSLSSFKPKTGTLPPLMKEAF